MAIQLGWETGAMELLIVVGLVLSLCVASALWGVDSRDLPHSGLS
jgi:hypothetical protein